MEITCIWQTCEAMYMGRLAKAAARVRPQISFLLTAGFKLLLPVQIVPSIFSFLMLTPWSTHLANSLLKTLCGIPVGLREVFHTYYGYQLALNQHISADVSTSDDAYSHTLWTAPYDLSKCRN